MHRIVKITLDQGARVHLAPALQKEYRTAVNDLLEKNFFAPHGVDDGPYSLHLSLQENRLTFDIRSSADVELGWKTLPLRPLSRLIHDYFLVCENYFESIKNAAPYQVEAMDMGRRGLHNEAAEMLMKILHDKIEIDFETARRLFTLICVLHISPHQADVA